MNRAHAAIAAAAVALAGCDWVQYAFMNSIPLEGRLPPGAALDVYIGVDGISWDTLQEATARGGFSGPSWRAAKLITLFPGTSDASWTRTLRTAKTGGYEFEYYDPHSDSIVNGGLAGVGRHITPTVHESLSFEAPYLEAFDYRSNGYLHAFYAYEDTWTSLGESLDNLFLILDGRAETTTVFTAYLLESDVLGHLATPSDCLRMLTMLASRMEEFRRAHPDRRVRYTLISDHGMDFTGIPGERLLDLRQELPKVGVTPVESLGGRDPAQGVFAIPIVHTRVTYLALHTHPALVAEVALRSSGLESVDFAVARLSPPAGPAGAKAGAWFGIWTGGRLSATFGYDALTSSYVLPAGGDFARWDVPIAFASGEPFRLVPDEELFRLTRHGRYPDLFYRARTSLSDLSVQTPADVLLSFRTGWGSVGFRLPADLDSFSGASHGSADSLGSAGILLTEVRELPEVVRADGFLDLFPAVAEHLRRRGVEQVPADPDAARPLR